MHTGDEYFDSQEFLSILEQYKENPSSLDADDLTDIADYYSFLNERNEALSAVQLASRMYPGALAPLSFLAREALYDKNIEEAKRIIGQVEDKSDIGYKLFAVEILIANDDIDEAEYQLNLLLDDIDEDRYDDFIIDVVNIYMDHNVPAKAEQWLLKNSTCQKAEYKELRAKVLLATGKIGESKAIFNELLDKDPFSIKYWNALATSQFLTGEYENSINSCDFALAIDPDNIDGLFTKGNCLYHMGKYEEALVCYRRYLTLEPKDELGYLNSGTCLLNLARYEESINLLKKALDVITGESDQLTMIYQELSHAYCAIKDWDEALSCISKAEKISPDAPDILVLKGHILLCKGQVKEAMAIFSDVSYHYHNDINVMIHIVSSVCENGYSLLAYNMFKTLIDKSWPESKYGNSYMALCCNDLGKVDEFLYYLEQATKRNPHEAQMILGNIFPPDLEPKDYLSFAKKQIENNKNE